MPTPPPTDDLLHTIALEQAQLSNERTMLAYARTALTLFLSAVVAWRFFAGDPFMTTLAGAFLVLSGITAWTGFQRFTKVRARILERSGD